MRLDKQDYRLLALWATDCAERVLPYCEENYPKDDPGMPPKQGAGGCVVRSR